MEEDIVCTGFFRPATEDSISCLDKFEMGGGLQYFFGNLLEAPFNLIYAIIHWQSWLDWSDNESLTRFIYYGASAELFFVLLLIFLVVTAIGLWRNSFMWGCVRVLEGFANGIGRFFAWAGLLMVLQQTIIIFMQRVFAASEISLGFGLNFTKDVSWWSEELKLYNAMIVCLCASYTFVQGGQVRVDLIYANLSYRTKRAFDMFGAMVFMVPAAVITYIYGWFFLWRHLVVPNPSASDTLDRLLAKSRALRWNVETIGFSPNGFNAYFLFKVLLVVFTLMVMLQAISCFYRAYLERKEGEASEDKYLDKDTLGDPVADLVADIH